MSVLEPAWMHDQQPSSLDPSRHFPPQRGCDPKPRVARHELPWVTGSNYPSTPTGLCLAGPDAGEEHWGRNAFFLLAEVGMARRAVRVACSGATIEPFATDSSDTVPPATTRAGTSQRDVPTTPNGRNPFGVERHHIPTPRVGPPTDLPWASGHNPVGVEARRGLAKEGARRLSSTRHDGAFCVGSASLLAITIQTR
jgi:hypothetical protein